VSTAGNGTAAGMGGLATEAVVVQWHFLMGHSAVSVGVCLGYLSHLMSESQQFSLQIILSVFANFSNQIKTLRWTQPQTKHSG
jgi:hypothetical protein